MKHFAGLDLGQRSDYTALVVARLTDQGVYEVISAKRWRGTAYTEVVQQVSRFVSDPVFGGVYLRVDATAVGIPIFELFEQARARGTLRVRELEPITFTAASESNPTKGTYPKRDLLERVRILLEQKRLVFAARLRLAKTIEQEIKHYGYQISAKGRDTYGGMGSTHDDLVTAVALAVLQDPGPMVLTKFDYHGEEWGSAGPGWNEPSPNYQPEPNTGVRIGRDSDDEWEFE